MYITMFNIIDIIKNFSEIYYMIGIKAPTADHITALQSKVHYTLFH